MKHILRCFIWGLLQSAACLSTSAFAAPPSRVAHPAPAALTLTGRVVNETGAPLPGVVVALKSAASTATTNAAGSFLLAVEELNPVLVVKCVGYQTQTVLVKVATPVTITLHPIGTAGPAQGAGVEAVSGLLNLADEQPAFPGGVEAYRLFLQKNVHYPENAKAKELAGDVFVSFVVDEAGRILDAEVAKGCGAGFDEEALRLIRLMPWWTPGKTAGQPVRVPCTLRIRFGMQAAPQP